MTKSELFEFIDYCQSFYDIERDDVLYPFATESQIVDAVLQHITLRDDLFFGDSVDRELVRDRIISMVKK